MAPLANIGTKLLSPSLSSPLMLLALKSKSSPLLSSLLLLILLLLLLLLAASALALALPSNPALISSLICELDLASSK